MADLKLYLLGPPHLQVDGQAVLIQRRKALALLCYLAVTGAPQRRDTLATLFWPDYEQRDARTALTRHLSELRKGSAHEFLISSRETVALSADIWLDVNHFQQIVADCDVPHPDYSEPLGAAVDLYRADFLSGFTLPDCPGFDEWQLFQSEGLRQQLAGALERLSAIEGELTNYEAAITYARRWLALDSLHESAHRQLMQLYGASGQWAAALRQYETCCQTLATELDAPPTPETTQLYEAIKTKRLTPPVKPALAQSVTDAGQPMGKLTPAAHTAAPPQSQLLHHLPPQATSFLGREVELTALDHLIRDPQTRLITIVGAGGMGKTRLALACAEAQLAWGRFANGIYFVPLAPLSAVDHIIPTMAEALGFQLDTGSQIRSLAQQIVDYLRQKRMLILMDNFEHLLDGAAIVAEILQHAPEVKILATARERLNLREEQIFAIQGLVFPDWETPEDAASYTAVQLFLQSAKRVRHDFALTTDDLTYLTRICRLVEGMPLGIELAASWVDTLTPADIAVEIQQSLDFLATDVRNAPARHRSMRAVFDTSWQRLSTLEQTLMALFSIFRGGFTRHAAQHITDASVRDLSVLTSKSLLQYNRAANRYQIHELLRQYSAERLARTPAEETITRDRHSAYYVHLLHQSETALKSAEQRTALTVIRAEIENVRAVWDWAIAQKQTHTLEQALESLGQFYEWYGRVQEGEAAFRAALGVVDASTEPRLRVRLSSWLATFCYWLGRIDEARMLREQGLALLDSPSLNNQDTRAEQAVLLLGLGRSVGFSAIDPQANQAELQLYEQSLALYETLHDRWGMAEAMFALCERGRSLRDTETVEQWWRQLAEVDLLGRRCEALCRASGNQAGLAKILLSLAANLIFIRPLDEALTTIEAAIALCQALGLKDMLLQTTSWRANILMFEGNYAQAQVANRAADELLHELGNSRKTLWISVAWGLIALAEQRYAEAQQILRASVVRFQEMGGEYHRVLTLAYLGIAEEQLGHVDVARQHLIELLRVTTDLYFHVFLVQGALYLAALHLAHQGAVERAIELYSLLSHLWVAGEPRLYEDIVGRYIDVAAASLPAVDVTAAQERGRTLDLWATAKAVLAELEA